MSHVDLGFSVRVLKKFGTHPRVNWYKPIIVYIQNRLLSFCYPATTLTPHPFTPNQPIAKYFKEVLKQLLLIATKDWLD